MSKKCDLCGAEHTELHSRILVNEKGQKILFCLCRECCTLAEKSDWISTEKAGMVRLLPDKTQSELQPQSQSLYKCSICKKMTDDVSVAEFENFMGLRKTGMVCSDCLNQNEKNENSGWTGLLKTISIITAIVITIAGIVLGANLIDSIVGILVGGIIGFGVGMATIAFTMVICEIATTLQEILVELRENKK